MRFIRHPFVRGVGVGVTLSVLVLLILAWTPLADAVCRGLLRPDTNGPAGAIVVLGAGLDERCQPNTNSIRRTVLGLRLFHGGRAPLIVFTGGTGTGAVGSCAVARAMADFAVEIGAPAASVIVEDQSTSTWENATKTAELLRPLGIRTVLVVTDGYHMRRAEACFERQGLSVERASVPSPHVHRNNLFLFFDVAREIAATCVYRLKGKV